MRINEETKLLGKQVVFVPYKKLHVAAYHEWMQSEQLLEQTASEPLTLEEEYEMQNKWWTDEDKCTFILLSRKLYDENSTSGDQRDIVSMVGDVNLFFNNDDDKHEAELEVMIAQCSARRQGFGRESVIMMMYYGVTFLSIERYVVKIGTANVASIKLFTSLGFQVQSHSSVFEETTFQLQCNTESFQTTVIQQVKSYIKVSKY